MMDAMKLRVLLGSILLGAVWLAPVVAAQAPSDATHPDSTQGTRMILKLADGSRVRSVAREVAGGFEVKSGDSWRLVSRADVVAARPEREAIVEGRRRLDEIPLAHVGARVEACGWMVDQGLDAEAVVELDRILRLLPDEPHVLRLLASNAPRIDLGVTTSTRDAWMREGARTCNIGASPVRRELVVQALRASTPVVGTSPQPAATGENITRAGAAPADPLRAALVTELDSSVFARRTFACVALRRLFPDAAIGQLAVHAVLDPSVDVRDEAILGLRAAQDPKACGMLVQALANPSGLVRTNALDAIGRIGYPEGVEPLIQLMITANAAAAAAGGSGGGPVRANLYVGLQTTYVQDFNVQIAQGASIADPIVGVLQSGIVFDVGVGGVSSVPITTEIWTAARSLVRLTGARIGADPPAWEKWWKENRHRYVPGAASKPGTRDG